MKTKKIYSTQQVADACGVAKKTLVRWIQSNKLPEVPTDANGWRVFNEQQKKLAVRYARSRELATLTKTQV